MSRAFFKQSLKNPLHLSTRLILSLISSTSYAQNLPLNPSPQPSPVSYSTPQIIPGKVIKISDGDTIHFLPTAAQGNILMRLKLRFDSIDTAELHVQGVDRTQTPPVLKMMSQGYWGEQGAIQLQKLLPIGTLATIKAYGLDKYGRTLSQVFVKGLNINLEMIRGGVASMYIICDDKCSRSTLIERRLTQFRNACLEASQKKIGFFDPKNPLPEWPFVFRARVQERPLHRLIGDMANKKYLAPTDYQKVNVCNRIFFESEADAKRMGFTKGF
jgi:endonuclease YncB( thermonuclease family)